MTDSGLSTKSNNNKTTIVVGIVSVLIESLIFTYHTSKTSYHTEKAIHVYCLMIPYASTAAPNRSLNNVLAY